MDEKFIDMEVHYKSKWDKLKHKAWKLKNKVEDEIRDHPKEAASIVLVGGAAIVELVKKWKKAQPTQAELDREWHDTHIYDRGLGMYYTLRRKMTAAEQLEFDRRKARGERTGDILRSMGLLKY